MGTENEQFFTQRFVPVAGVALAGIIQVSSQTGPFSLWNVMIGVPLTLLLAAYVPRSSMRTVERAAWSATCAFTLMSTLGIFLQAAYRLFKGLHGLVPPFTDDAEWEAPSEYYFSVWLLFSAGAFVYLGRNRESEERARKAVPNPS